MVQPHIATVVQVGRSHIGFLKTQENIAKEKEQIYQHASPDGILVFNMDNVYTRAMHARIKHSPKHQNKKLIQCSSQDKKADVFMEIQEIGASYLIVKGCLQGVQGSTKVAVTGAEHLSNLMQAAALALAARLTPEQIWQSLPLCQLPPGRNQWVTLQCGAKALFDAYNASPESVMGMLDHFLSKAVMGKKLLILGDFLELGDYLAEFHQKLAHKLCNPATQHSHLHTIWFIGSQAQVFRQNMEKLNPGTIKLYFSEHDDPKLAKKILSVLDPSFIIALKASRKMQMEKTLSHFQPVDFHAL